MRSALGVSVATLIIVFSASAATAQSPSANVRGTIESVQGNTLAVKAYDGKTMHVMLESGTKYAWVVPSSLSDLKSGNYIGTAATGPKKNLVATEVSIFPESMRGMGEGHYSWNMPATVARADAKGGSGSSSGSMTNGSMTNGSMTNGSMTNGSMTNGSVNSANRRLTVSYNGQKVHVTVPPNTPVVRFDAAQKSILSPGKKVFIMASKSNGKLDAKFVAVGKNGLMPPM